MLIIYILRDSLHLVAKVAIIIQSTKKIDEKNNNLDIKKCF